MTAHWTLVCSLRQAPDSHSPTITNVVENPTPQIILENQVVLTFGRVYVRKCLKLRSNWQDLTRLGFQDYL